MLIALLLIMVAVGIIGAVAAAIVTFIQALPAIAVAIILLWLWFSDPKDKE